MFADAIRQQAEAAPRAALPAVTAALWRAVANGQVTEGEAETLAALIDARRLVVGRTHNQNLPAGQNLSSPVSGTSTNVGNPYIASEAPGSRRTGVGSRPRTDVSLERRRRWAASGRLPPAIAARFTAGEQAVLALVAAETVRRKDCRLAIEHIAAIAGVGRSTVKNALREARRLGLITVEERKVTGWRNDTNVVRIVSAEWTAWLRLTRRSPIPASPTARTLEGGGVKSATGTPTQVQIRGKPRPAKPSKMLPGGSERPQPMQSRENSRGR
ncbi:helix-turn-helix domain-containing protein [Methylobacterium sp. CCH5-D2]|uniref:helix-turn-helix domain-containing protein n=1 Tax=Methylobacterium sp. CCH5-D2 TaxID=1768765 RepID=UPI0009EB1723|nr:helix-turn-helix domain-containing protein [Methylobacterium sp. CCH5-D2]